MSYIKSLGNSKSVSDPNSRWRLLNLFPVFGSLFDYLESISSIVMVNYPQQTFLFDTLAPIFTLIKWFFINGSLFILVPALMVAGWRWIRVRKNRE